MNCIHCRGAMRRSIAPFHVDRHGYHLALDAVPAWVCGQCGEPYFQDREVDAIQGAIRILDEQTRRLATGVRRIRHGAS
ncbi:MAG: YgiT-type zinc finger protein [Gammaproteobacteria bacterium]|nr:YgiT-type zinc finger protein [Gammaproteobacteria bacterium]